MSIDGVPRCSTRWGVLQCLSFEGHPGGCDYVGSPAKPGAESDRYQEFASSREFSGTFAAEKVASRLLTLDAIEAAVAELEKEYKHLPIRVEVASDVWLSLQRTIPIVRGSAVVVPSGLEVRVRYDLQPGEIAPVYQLRRRKPEGST